ncbi:MAG: hypothetical protein F6K63_21180 [Moorea sp. SIO1G6]|nr:hypothetical protein [Moorena sp. SIO1G6]
MVFKKKPMECPKCHSNKTHKYGHQRAKQRYKCNECGGCISYL